MARVDPFVVQWPNAWVKDPEIAPVINYLNLFLHDLWTRTGGGTDIIEQEIVGVSAVDSQSSLALGVATEALNKTTLTTVTTIIDHTANDNEFINAKGGALITFPQFPSHDSVIIVRNGDGSTIRLNGNGKNINGSTTGNIYQETTTIEFYYFLDSDEWFAR